jgi:hypothetical protein
MIIVKPVMFSLGCILKSPGELFKIPILQSRAWWYMPVIPAHGRLRQKDENLRSAWTT